MASNDNDNNQQPLSNNSAFRTVSDNLDKMFGWAGYDAKDSKARAAIHASYHETQYRLGKFTNCDTYKAVNETLGKYNCPVTLPTVSDNQREHEQAKDQWGVISGGPRDNLEKYDAQQKK